MPFNQGNTDSAAHGDCDQKWTWRLTIKYIFGMSCQECCLPAAFFGTKAYRLAIHVFGLETVLRVIKPFCCASDFPILNSHICEIGKSQLRQMCPIPQTRHGKHLSVYQKDTHFLPLLVICSSVSWLQADQSLPCLFITVTQSGVLGPQRVLINDSSWQLKAFRRMIFQFWAWIQAATQKYHASISASALPSHPLSTAITFSSVV